MIERHAISGTVNKDFNIEGNKEICLSYAGASSHEEYILQPHSSLILSMEIEEHSGLSVERTFHIHEQASLAINAHINTDSSLDIATNIVMYGKGAKASENLSILCSGNSKTAIRTLLDHREENTEAESNTHIVNRDNSSSFVRGLIRIGKGCRGSSSHLNQHILLLDNGIAHTVPSLEIDNNDVEASHSSQVSTVDQEELFYMMSRGIDGKSAEEEIVRAFLRR